MKKFLTIIGIVATVGVLALSSCKTNNRLCPAYPPTPRQTGLVIDNNNQDIATLDQQVDVKQY